MKKYRSRYENNYNSHKYQKDRIIYVHLWRTISGEINPNEET
jgi:hypothetical protein